MWLSFFGAFFVVIVFLYLPGYFFFRATRLSNTLAVIVAPTYSVGAYCVMGITLPPLNVSASFFAVFLPVLCFAIFLFLGSCWMSPPREGRDRNHRRCFGISKGIYKEDARHLVLYVAVGLATSVLIYVKCLNGPESFVQTYDNNYHYGLVRSFVQSGIWSPFQATLYPQGYGLEAPPLPGGEYYPAAWHLVSALVATTLSVSISLSTNVVNLAFVGVVYPSAMYFLMRSIFSDNSKIIALGAFASMASCAYPWVLLMAWPLYPNTASMAYLPMFIAAFIFALSYAKVSRQRFAFFLVLAFCAVDFVFLQPNVVFAAAVFLAPYCAWRIFQSANHHFSISGKASPVVKATACSAAFLIASALAWFALSKAPFFQGVVQYYWAPIASTKEAFFNLISMGLARSTYQWALSILIVFGIAWTLVEKRYTWVVFPFVFSCLVFWVSASFEDVPVKHLLSGFWYTDPYRVAALVSVFSVPIASIGLYGIWTSAQKILGARDLLRPARNVVSASLVSVLLVAIYFSAGFSKVIDESTVLNVSDFAPGYDTEEIAFVEKVKAEIDPNDLILNLPYDGSMFAYGIDGLNLYNRYISGYADSSEANASIILREKLCDIESDSEVRTAIAITGADYILLLKRDTEQMKLAYTTFHPEEWEGYLRIGDDTPGLEIIMQSGEMRLYKIVSD